MGNYGLLFYVNVPAEDVFYGFMSGWDLNSIDGRNRGVMAPLKFKASNYWNRKSLQFSQVVPLTFSSFLCQCHGI